MTFDLDPRLESDTVFIADLELCTVLLNKNALYPWLILVPRRAGIVELSDMTHLERSLLLAEVSLISDILSSLCQPDKVNIANLGNVVPMFHMHIVARFKSDKAWPNPIWGRADFEPYGDVVLNDRVTHLRKMIQESQKTFFIEAVLPGCVQNHDKNLQNPTQVISHHLTLLLDFDNTLMQTESLALPSLINRFNQLYEDRISHPLTLEIFKKEFHGLAKQKLCQKLSEYYGIDVDFEALYFERESYIAQMMKEEGVLWADGVLETLLQLKEKGLTISSGEHYHFSFAVVTNNSVARAMAALRASSDKGRKLLSIIGANWFEAFELQKPNPEVYLRAMRELGICSDTCFAIEDSIAGVSASQAANIRTIGYLGISKSDLSSLVECINDFRQLPNTLTRLLETNKISA